MKVAIHTVVLVLVCLAAAWGSAQAQPPTISVPVVAR